MSLEQRLTEAITQTTERTPAPTFDLAGIRRDARRRTAMRVASLTAALAVAAGLAGVQLSGDDRSAPPVIQPTSTPSPSPTATSSTGADLSPTSIPEVRDQQVVVTWDQPPAAPSLGTMLARQTSEDLDNAKNGEVSVEVQVYGYMDSEDFGWERYCYGAPGTWWVITVEPHASWFDYGHCDGSGQASSLSLPGVANDGPMVGEPVDLPGRATTVEVRMILTNEDPTAYYDCVALNTAKNCGDVEPPHAVGAGAQFGVSAFGREPVLPATTIFGSEIYPAARVSGTTYSFTTAVAAATGSRLLTYRLPPSKHARIVQAMAGDPEPCRHTDAQRTGPCLPVPQLRIDGRVVGNQNDFLVTTLAAQTRLAPGGAHEITLEIPATDTDELDLGFVVFQAREN